MSLTSILKKKEYLEIRTKIEEFFPKPPLNLYGELLAPPLTKNYGGVGTAFDYLLRFYLKRKNRNAVADRLGAVKAFYTIQHHAKDNARQFYFKGNNIDSQQFIEEIKTLIKMAQNDINKYLASGYFTDELLKTFLLFSQLEAIYRKHYYDPKIGLYNPDDITDLKQLAQFIDDKNFVVKENIFLSPGFGEGTKLVGGADVDLIIDDAIIEIKTTKHLKLDIDHYHQLICYYTLYLIGGITNDKHDQKIEKIGIYFSRHGKLWTIPISALGTTEKFMEFKEWFQNYIEENVKKK